MTVKHVRIEAPVARAGVRAPAQYINHHCPFCCNCTLSNKASTITDSDFCQGTMDWEKFTSHLNACIEADKNARRTN